MTAIPIQDGNFNIGVNAVNGRKRALNYIGFSGGNAILVADQSAAAVFTLTIDGYLMSGGLFVDADTADPYLAFSLTATPPVTVSMFQVDDATLQITLVSANRGFCVDDNNGIFIIFDQDPPFSCTPVILTIEKAPSKSAASTAFFTNTNSF
jgi:hypothetical protein